MKYQVRAFLLLLTLSLSFQCKKQNICTDPVCQLPPATQTGTHTFGCLVDGKPWTANTSDAWSVKKLSVGSRIVDGDTFFIIRAGRRYEREGIDRHYSFYTGR